MNSATPVFYKVQLVYPCNGGTQVVEFGFLKTAQSYARELGLTKYKIVCGSSTLESRHG